jgi:hypothetical protein
MGLRCFGTSALFNRGISSREQFIHARHQSPAMHDNDTLPRACHILVHCIPYMPQELTLRVMRL